MALGVKVVEVARVARIENGGAVNCECLIGADGETGGVNGTSLGRVVELELRVGSDVTGVTTVAGQDTVGELDGELAHAAVLPLRLMLVKRS